MQTDSFSTDCYSLTWPHSMCLNSWIHITWLFGEQITSVPTSLREQVQKWISCVELHAISYGGLYMYMYNNLRKPLSGYALRFFHLNCRTMIKIVLYSSRTVHLHISPLRSMGSYAELSWQLAWLLGTHCLAPKFSCPNPIWLWGYNRNFMYT